MAFTYTPSQVYLSAQECQSSITPPSVGMGLTYVAEPCPSTPPHRSIPLPESMPQFPTGHRSAETYKLYPIRFMENSESLTFSQSARLFNLELASPIHIHTQALHLGVLHPLTIPINQITALDVVLYLRSFAQEPISTHAYSQLPRFIRDRVEQSYQIRVGNVDVNTDIQNTFTNSNVGRAGLLGRDLLLANMSELEVWGIEVSSCGMSSIIHIA